MKLFVVVILIFLNFTPSNQQCLGPPVKLHPYQCCSLPQLFDDNVMSSCRVKYQSMMSYEQTASHCFLTCALQATNMAPYIPATVDGLTQAVTTQFRANGEDQFASIVTNAIFTCLNSLQSPLLSKMKQGGGEYICDPNSLLIKGCINILIAANCPANRQIQEAGCDVWRQYWQQCKPPYVV